MQISGDYITFAGMRELRAWRVTASNGATAYAMEFEDKNALFAWLLDVVEFDPEQASAYVEHAVRGELVSVNFYMGEDVVRGLGFREPGKPFTPPNLF
jgi:hypothetical protein